MTRTFALISLLALLLCSTGPASAESFTSASDLQCGSTDVDGAVHDAANRVLASAVAHLQSLAGTDTPESTLVDMLSGNLHMRIDVKNVYRNGRTPCPSVTVTGTVPMSVESSARDLAAAPPSPQPQQQAEPMQPADQGQDIAPLTERTYYEPQDWQLELQKATLAVATDATNPYAHAQQAVALARLNRPVEALEAVNKALELESSNPEGLYARGLIYSHYGQYDKAVEDFTASLARRPDDTRAYVQRGVALKNMSRFEDAVQDFDRALLSSPGDVSVYTNRGIAYAGMDRMDMAVSDLSSAVQLSPSDPWPYIYRGLAFYQTGEHKLMCQDFEKAHYRGKPEGTEWAKRKKLCE